VSRDEENVPCPRLLDGRPDFYTLTYSNILYRHSRYEDIYEFKILHR
jgi:hypothetical protein